MVTLINKADLHLWSEKSESIYNIPRLIRLLVDDTTEKLVKNDFATDKAVSSAGYDGIVITETTNQFVPNGMSVWELSTRKDVEAKANEDYAKRTKDPLGVDIKSATFLCVTSRSWPGKDAWAKEKSGESKWKEVRAYDSEDIAHWIEYAPRANTWLRSQLGYPIEGLQSLSDFWKQWSSSTSPEISYKLLLARRKDCTAEIISWLEKPGQHLLCANTKDEAMASFTAVLLSLPQERSEALIDKSIVVNTNDALNFVLRSNNNLIIICRSNRLQSIPEAIKKECYVIIPQSPNERINNESYCLTNPSKHKVAEVLEKDMGLNRDEAHRLATEAKGRISVIVRSLGGHVTPPTWAEDNLHEKLIPLLLVGSWDLKNKADIELVESITGCKYEEVSRQVQQWLCCDDPPLFLINNICGFISRIDSWEHLSKYVSTTDVDKFKTLAVKVLSEINPKYELSEDNQWMASVYGKLFTYSEPLRKGIIETIALLATRYNSPDNSFDGQVVAGQIVSDILSEAKDWHLWASLSRILPDIAEIAPEVFMSNIESNIIDNDDMCHKLFEESKAPMGGEVHYLGILWGLECLAWSPSYLTRASLILARMAEKDPGGNVANRPANSLLEIFTGWRPQTTADLKQRLDSIDKLFVKTPEVTFKLCLSLLKQGHSGNIYQPRWRDWNDDWKESILRIEVATFCNEITTKIFEASKNNISLIETLIKDINRLPHNKLSDLLLLVKTYATSDDEHGKLRLWHAIRAMLYVHKYFNDAHWALKPEAMVEYETVFQNITPQNLTERLSWLFMPGFEHPEVAIRDYNDKDKRVAELQRDAAEQLYSKCKDAKKMIQYANSFKEPMWFGLSVGASTLSNDTIWDIINNPTSKMSNAEQQFFVGVVRGCLKRNDWMISTIKSIKQGFWENDQIVLFLTSLHFDRGTWDFVADFGNEIKKLYWSRVTFISSNNDDALQAITELQGVDRPYAALSIIHYHIFRNISKLTIPTDIIKTTLNRCARKNISEETPPAFIHDLGYEIEQVFEYLTNHEPNKEDVAKLEFQWLPAIKHHRRRPLVLHDFISKSPEMFSECIKTIYKAENETISKIDENMERRIEHTRDLLDSWHDIPGRLKDGSIDEQFLKNWIAKVRQICAASSRGKIVDFEIGKMLSRIPYGNDKLWPPEKIRDLIEDLIDDNVQEGFLIGTINDRGVVCKSFGEGGDQEIEIQKRYDAWVATLSVKYPKTASMLKRCSEHYRLEAKSEDGRADLDD